MIEKHESGKAGSDAAVVDKQLSLVLEQLDDDKAEGIVTIPMAGKSSFADYMVIASGRSSRQVGAMAEHLEMKLKENGAARIAVEGAALGDWVLIDTGDIIIHLFRPEIRAFYNLEKMWGVEIPIEVSDGSAAA